MANLTDSACVNRLIRLLMMLPAPESSTYASFWDKVAQEHRVNRSYLSGNIAGPLHQILLTPEENQVIPRRNLAKYTLFFFGDPSNDLVEDITSEVDPGAPNKSAGQTWVEQVRLAAFDVLEETQTDAWIQESTESWLRLLSHRSRRYIGE